MNVNKFNLKYGKYGGIRKLTELRSLFLSQDYIADYFKVSKQRVRQWMLEFFGSVYDTREERAGAVRIGMIDFAKNNSKEEFFRAFHGSPYLSKDLVEIINDTVYAEE